MFKALFYFLFLLVLPFSLCGQVNLVPNPSFEDTVSCPSGPTAINQSVGWYTCSYTPDYYNSCSAYISPQSNWMGPQIPATGNAFAGFIAFYNNNQKEIIGTQLTQSLVIGQKYFVSIKVSLAEVFSPPNQYGFIPCNKPGVRFSNIQYSAGNPVPIDNYAQVYTNTIISDTANWTTISGSFIADSSYQYIMIGNFFDDQNTDTINRYPGGFSYFFVDDVCVSTDSLACVGTDGIKNETVEYDVKFFPNPMTNSATLSFNNPGNKNYCFELYNDRGELVLSKNNIRTGQVEIERGELSSGLYFFRLVAAGEEAVCGKLVIE